MRSTRCFLVVVSLSILATTLALPAASKTWSGSGDWYVDTANWTPAGAPGAGDDVVINSGTVTNTSSTANLNSYLIKSGATHVFSNWNTKLTAVSVVISGNVTHVVNSDTNGAPGTYADWTPDARVYIECTNLLLASVGTINVNYKGFQGGFGHQTYWMDGRGPGGGSVGYNSIGMMGGGGYGGAGGNSATINGTNYGSTYGTASAPVDPGSGGGGRYGCCSDFSRYGGSGGGAVRIDATGLVTLNGTISAIGQNWTVDGNEGPGSGGGVYITCRAVAGSGTVITDGGIANFGGGGAGGRIALVYDLSAQSNQNAVAKPTLLFSSSPGTGIYGNGRAGTIYVSDASFYPSSWVGGGTPIIPGFSGTAFVFNTLTITNGVLTLPVGVGLIVSNDLTMGGTQGGLEVRQAAVQIGGNMTYAPTAGSYINLYYPPTNALSVGGNLTFNGNNANVYFYATNNNSTAVTVGQSFIVTNNAKFYLYCAATNAGSPGYSIGLDIGKDLIVGAGSWIYPVSHEVNGGSVRFHAKNLTLLGGAAGGFEASSYGYRGGEGRSGGLGVSTPGYGPGGGYPGGGGGYGGFGANFSTVNGTNYGYTYGRTNAPMFAGSGGGGRPGCCSDTSRMGSWGGGLIWLVIDRFALINGAMNVNGGTVGGDVSDAGAGSGGGIYLSCRTLQGTNGNLRANGGSAAASNGGYGGGGGRIAVWSTFDLSSTQTWTITASPGPGKVSVAPARDGGTGTVFWGFLPIPEPGLMIQLR